jgi:hypothetical protein
MQQLCIEYFYPLTEQIGLDLDYEPSIAYAKKLQEERWKNSVTLTSGMGLMAGSNGVAWATVGSSHIGAPSFTINVDQMPITIVSKKKPNFVKQFIYKTLGMKWKSE